MQEWSGQSFNARQKLLHSDDEILIATEQEVDRGNDWRYAGRAPSRASRGARCSHGPVGACPSKVSSVIIIIHLLGLAPAGWVAAPDKRPNMPPTMRCDGCHAVPLNAADSMTPRLRPRFGKGDDLPHTYPLTLDRWPFARFQLCAEIFREVPAAMELWLENDRTFSLKCIVCMSEVLPLTP
jgi:hypothetical protein